MIINILLEGAIVGEFFANIFKTLEEAWKFAAGIVGGTGSVFYIASKNGWLVKKKDSAENLNGGNNLDEIK